MKHPKRANNTVYAYNKLTHNVYHMAKKMMRNGINGYKSVTQIRRYARIQIDSVIIYMVCRGLPLR